VPTAATPTIEPTTFPTTSTGLSVFVLIGGIVGVLIAFGIGGRKN